MDRKEIEKNLLAVFPGGDPKIDLPHISDRLDQYETELKGFDTNPWGSCQYYTAWVTYEFCRDLIKEIGLENFKAFMDIPGAPAKPIDQVFQELKALLTEDLNDHNECCLSDDEDIMELPTEEVDFAVYAEVTKSLASDLWSSYIPFFSIYDLTGLCPIDLLNWEPKISVPGRGPIFNQMAQEDNIMIGISAALIEAEYPEHFNPLDWADYDT